MAAKRKIKAGEAQLTFEALSIEGGLLSPEWLSKVAQLQAGIQGEADYRIPKGLNLRDEIGRYWRIGQAHWADFKSGRDVKADPKAVSERFVLGLLCDAFGFTSITAVEPAIVAERSYPIGYAALAGRVPVVIAAAGSGLDTPVLAFGAGSRKRSAFGLTQEYLNAQEGALWGIASDGASLRIERDNASLTRPAWIEADLERIFSEERYADFAAFWLLCHETRFGREGQPVTECALESWRNAGREEGTRAREHLRRGVEEALVALGQGFLGHVDNIALRADLQDGTLPVTDFFNQLLRLVYRIIFLLTVEERGLLHPEGTSNAAKELYVNGYGMRRLRERSVKRSAHDRFSDLWEATKVVFRGLGTAEPRLGLPALAGIFAASQCTALDLAKLENRALLLAVFKLAWLREDRSLSRVNWRDMGPEELGSVYESLLELVPQITRGGRQFAFAAGGEMKGNARKTTGSYYTPDSLVQVLLDSALEPVIADTVAKNPVNAIEALLSLSIVDPACGSGHFLLAAARRLASHVARLQANGTPSAAEYQHALRQIVGRCIFGVDLNPMAVELCKVGLWMEAVEPGMPLTFLDSHIQHGNALLGTTPELMATKGIPDGAWDPIEGDDKKTASALKKKNKAEAGGQRTLTFGGTRNGEIESEAVSRAVAELDAASDAKLEELTMKEARWGDILDSPEYRHQKFVADAWCAAFVWPKQPGDLAEAAPTNELWRQLREGVEKVPALTTKVVGELSKQYRFFHWHLQFPQVFGKGGFDVVLGNPPWDMNEIKDNEFFASSFPEILAVKSAKDKAIVLERIGVEAPALFNEYRQYARNTEGVRQFVMASGRFPLAAVGRLNLYRLFLEHGFGSLAEKRWIGLVVPSGFVSDSFSQPHFVALHANGHLRRFYDFENVRGLFPSVHRSFRFALLVASRSVDREHESTTIATDFVFYASGTEELANRERHVFLGPNDVERVNPDTKTAPLFRTRRDQEITLQLYKTGVTLGSDREDGWRVSQVLMFMMNASMTEHRSGSELSREYQLDGATFARGEERWLPLLEGKMVGMYDHRAADVRFDESNRVRRNQAVYLSEGEHADPSRFALPMFWVPERVLRERTGTALQWLLAVKDVTASTNERTCVAAVLPNAALTDSLPWLKLSRSAKEVSGLAANLNSFACDFGARQKVAGLHLRGHYLAQLPVLPPSAYSSKCPWLPSRTQLEFILPRVLELTYTAWDLEPFARDVGYNGPPFRWDPERRFLLQCELDAAFFHLYGLSNGDVDYVMDTFPIVRKNDEKVHSEYRTKRIVLEIYDAMADAVRTGRPYSTLLDPLPGTPGASHGTFVPDGTPKDYAEALRAGLLFMLVRHSGETGISMGALSRALLWVQDVSHAKAWLDGAALTEVEHAHDADALLAVGATDSKIQNLLDALEVAKAVTRDASGKVRVSASGLIPTWLPQTPTLVRLASVMRDGLEKAERGANPTRAVDSGPTGKEKSA
ncbi:Eco57I restriction-modification methylase domain-containing protein [Paraburkholderia sacchari]|uniref:Eco57I restriction-modification methylase domain-containing protein n=1 Tax=Paraburkholderia sacchari TaxID=159450 RepID=UPI003D99A769